MQGQEGWSGLIAQHKLVMKTIATDLTAFSGHPMDLPPWVRRCWLGGVRLRLAEGGSLPCAWVSGEGSGAVPVLSDRRRWRQLIQGWRDNARPRRFRDPFHREMCSRFAAIRDKSRNRMRKVSCPASRLPAPPLSLRHTAPKNQSPAGCNDLPSRVCLNWSPWTNFGLILRNIVFFLFPVPFLLSFAVEWWRLDSIRGLYRHSRARIGGCGGRMGREPKKPLRPRGI
jgi:hypothetical protein